MVPKIVLRNSAGFTLIELMISIAIMSSMALAYMNLSERMIDSERKMLEMIEMNELITRLRYQLNDSVACNKTLSIEKYQDGFRLPTKLEKIVDRNGRTILSVQKTEGKFKVEQIMARLEDADLGALEQFRILNLILLLKSTNKNSKAMQFKLSVPVLVDTFKDMTPRFLYCDSFTNGIANDLTNVLMERTCRSFQVSYDKQTGLCDFTKSLGLFQPNEETMRTLQKFFNQDLQNR